jgi:magnesium transporter
MELIAFNFETKHESAIRIEDIPASPPRGIFYWLNIVPGEEQSARDALAVLGANPVAVDGLLGPQIEARYELYENAVHFSVSEAWQENNELKTGTTEFLLGVHYLAVMLPGPSPVMDLIRRTYREDFHKFARTPGFLLYELGSHLLESYRRLYQHFINEVERIQLHLFGQVTDDIFLTVSKLTADILSFRRMVLASRDLFNELATRKSTFVSETTQPSLDILSARMARLGDDLESERNVLTETLNLYMGMVSHRTNRIVNRLTIFSMIFLPLSFLCGVYGMNFDVMPELHWPYAYLVFWIVAIAFVISFIIFFKKRKWI